MEIATKERKMKFRTLLAAGALMLVGMTTTSAHAGDSLAFGGFDMCRDVTNPMSQALSDMQAQWVFGYWSGLNSAMPVQYSFTGEKVDSNAIWQAVLVECRRNPRQALATATQSVYWATSKAGL
jgi:hypothetical protein